MGRKKKTVQVDPREAELVAVMQDSARRIAKIAGLNLQTDANDRAKETARKWQRNYARVYGQLRSIRGIAWQVHELVLKDYPHHAQLRNLTSLYVKLLDTKK